MITTMALVTAAVLGFPTIESANVYCEQALRSDSGGRVIASLVIEAARDGTFIGSTLTVNRPSFEVSWQITKPLLDRTNPGVSMQMNDVGLPRGTAFPVTVSLLIDGSVTWRRSYAAATSTIIDTDAMIRAGLPVHNALAFGHPGISPEVEAAGLTTLFGAGRRDSPLPRKTSWSRLKSSISLTGPRLRASLRVHSSLSRPIERAVCVSRGARSSFLKPTPYRGRQLCLTPPLAVRAKPAVRPARRLLPTPRLLEAALRLPTKPRHSRPSKQ